MGKISQRFLSANFLMGDYETQALNFFMLLKLADYKSIFVSFAQMSLDDLFFRVDTYFERYTCLI